MTTSRTLILMRHAAAGGAHRDHDRPLTPGGARDAAAAGDWIRQHLPAVDAVLSSTAVRTRQTLAATRIDAPARFADELYGGDIDDILEQIALTPEEARTVLVVGHAPGIPSVAHELATVAGLIAADTDANTDANDDANDHANDDANEPFPRAGQAADSDTGGDSDGDTDTDGGTDSDTDTGTGEPPEIDSLRFFSACAVAVMTTDARWAELAERGANLLTVRRPEH